MSRCPQCGSKECCGGGYSERIEELEELNKSQAEAIAAFTMQIKSFEDDIDKLIQDLGGCDD